MNEITRWFETLGISPLLGGAIVGAIVVFLLTRRSDRNVPALGTAAAPSSADRKSLRQSGVTAAFTQIRIENNGQPIELSPEASSEVMDLLRKGDKIGAIKVLRTATGLGLAESKNMVEAMERSGIGQ